MPGISAVVALHGELASWTAAAERALDGLLHDPRYGKRVLLRDDFCDLAATSYAGYPIDSFQAGGSLVVLDGRLYGISSVERRRKLARLAEMARDADDDGIRDWVEATDGDYVVLIADPRRAEIVLVNDLLGGLPVYFAERAGAFFLSRELRYVAALSAPVRFDREAMAQHLLFGYPLGDATLLGGVRRLAPASRLRLTRREPASARCLRELDFDDREGGSRAVVENAAMLAELLGAACETRAAHASPAVVSLSGGFDSRTIAASLQRRGIAFQTATFADPVGNSTADTRILRSLAPLLGVELDIVSLPAPGIAEARKLLRLRSGMNSLGMSFLLPFLDHVRERWGNEAVLLTGESGNFTLPALSPHTALRDLGEVADFVLHTQAKMPITLVESLTGVSPAEIRGDLEERLLAYPESGWARKYAHFLIYERRLRWQTEGQERNRSYVWNTDPFQGVAFFRAAMACPDEQKRSHALYREVLQRISPEVAAVAHAGVGSPITSARFRADAKAVEMLRAHPEALDRLRALRDTRRRYGPGSAVPRILALQLGSCAAVGNCLSPSALQRMIDDCRSYSTEQLDLVLTLTSVIEDLTTGRSSLDELTAESEI